MTFLRLLFAIAIHATALTAIGQDSKVNEIRKMEELQVKAVLNQDSMMIKKIIANDLVVNAPTNSIFNATVVMDAFKAGYINYSSYVQQIDTITINENIGIVMGLEIVKPTGLTGNVGKTEKRRFTDIWMYKNNQWQMIARQATNISIE